MGGDLEEDWGRSPKKFEVGDGRPKNSRWGTAHAYVPQTVWKVVLGMHEVSKKGYHKRIFQSQK